MAEKWKTVVISRNQHKVLLITVLITLFMSQSCTGIAPTSTFEPVLSHTATDIAPNTPELTIAPSSISTSTIIGTAIPRGTFALLIYPPLIMNYDASTWKDKPHYADISSKPAYAVLNYLQSLSLLSCQIGVQGPTGDFPATPETIQLNSVLFEVITFTDTPTAKNTAYYIANKSLTGFNYEIGSPVLTVQASSWEWNKCRALAEKVLSTLYVP